MYERINETYFIDRFRLIRPKNFSYEALLALYDYIIKEEEEANGEEIELDIIRLCGDFTEYATLEEYNKENKTAYSTIEDLEKEGKTIIKFQKGFIIQE